MARPSKLDKQLQSKITKLLQAGNTIAVSCQQVGIGERTYYEWLARGNSALDSGDESESETPFAQFSQAVTRALSHAHIAAVSAVRTGIVGSKQKVQETETFTETRFRRGKNGEQEPYEYTRTTKMTRVVSMPPDWRAGIEYLRRRDPDHWSDKLSVEVDFKLLEALAKAAEAKGYPLSDVLSAVMAEIASADNSDNS